MKAIRIVSPCGTPIETASGSDARRCSGGLSSGDFTLFADGDDVSRKIEKVGMPSNHYTPSRLGSIEELPFALGFILLNDGEYYKSLYDGINSGRNTDSIGVIIGVILGAMYGSEVIEDEDRALLEKANRLDFDEITEVFVQTAVGIICEDIAQAEMVK